MNDENLVSFPFESSTSMICSICNRTAIVSATEDVDGIWFFLPDGWEFDDITKKFTCPNHKEYDN